MAKVLIIGVVGSSSCGGREHALGWKLNQSPRVEKIFFSPGNAGTSQEGINVNLNSFEEIYEFIQKEKIDLTIIGPEQTLEKGIVNYLENRNCKVFGPTKEAAILEADKFFSYDIMEDLHIPQALSKKCKTKQEAIDAINSMNECVIKARGLAAGKGVTVCDNKEDALKEISEHSEKFGNEVLIAERLYGEEFSVFGISDGKTVTPIEISFQDHKRAYDSDEGPNTGGMGAYGPAPIANKEMVLKVNKEVMTPVVQEMRERGIEYKGFIYAGMILTEEGPKVIEFNARFGDPECQPAMMMIKSDFYEIITSALEGKTPKIEFNSGAACCVVLASPGYPGKYEKGLVITGFQNSDNVKIFHAGTKKENAVLTNGGRVLGVTGYGKNIKEARDLAYAAVAKLKIPGGFMYRKDIANKAL